MTAQAQQKLKDLLYSGKLKMDSNSVVRKTDDLSSKIDTTQKKGPEPEKAPVGQVAATAAVPVDSAKKAPAPAMASAAPAATVAPTTTTAETKETATPAEAAPEPAAPATTAPVKSNTKIWKEYSDALVGSLKTEVLTSKKIKKETYYITVGYEIGTDGQVSITNVTTAPENAILQEQVLQRISSAPPQLAPTLDSSNKPRKVKRVYNFTVTKE